MSGIINIIVNCAAKNKSYNIEIDLQTKVEDLTSEFSQVAEQNKQQKITIYYEGQELDPHQTIAHYGIKKGSQLDLKLKFGIVVNYPQKHKVYNIEIDDCKKVGDLQKQFMNLLASNEEISFKYVGQILDPNKTLVSQNVQSGSQLDMHLASVGGKNDILIWGLSFNQQDQSKNQFFVQ